MGCGIRKLNKPKEKVKFKSLIADKKQVDIVYTRSCRERGQFNAPGYKSVPKHFSRPEVDGIRMCTTCTCATNRKEKFSLPGTSKKREREREKGMKGEICECIVPVISPVGYGIR